MLFGGWDGSCTAVPGTRKGVAVQLPPQPRPPFFLGSKLQGRLGCAPVFFLGGDTLCCSKPCHAAGARCLGAFWRRAAWAAGSSCGRVARASRPPPRRRRPYASRWPCPSNRTPRTAKSSPDGPRPLSRSRSCARVTGYLDKICFKDGTEVKQGDLLFQIDPRPFQAAYEQAAAQVEGSARPT